MSSYSETSARSTSAKPATLTAAMGVAIVSGIAAIANGVVILAGGLDLIKELGNKLVAKEVGVSEAEVSATLGWWWLKVAFAHPDRLKATFSHQPWLG